eukprot:CAMPEP_0119016288 /NCGR_PEP_ID=MMETSP1176-20130426/11914_1 /TAXON_ID=265551 /ORGANISM="Synedropsis recta cf, Strain CCMP1620" /LENGTH=287 /DNA_ID=CAMNT_0006969631 /DNA_START=217 /DNA_END=1080 /DNA_ORIENTATION=-
MKSDSLVQRQRCLSVPVFLLALMVSSKAAGAFTVLQNKKNIRDSLQQINGVAPITTTGARFINFNTKKKTRKSTGLSVLRWPVTEVELDEMKQIEAASNNNDTAIWSLVEAPVALLSQILNGDRVLSSANLEPENETTFLGMSFLATNVAFGLCGSLLATQGNAALGVVTEIACFGSFLYHFSQLKFGQHDASSSSSLTESDEEIVKLALLVDYFFAIAAIVVAGIQLIFSSHQQIPSDVIYSGSMAIASLGACLIWEEGVAYIIFHSLWHVFSAYTCYMIGSTSTY